MITNISILGSTGSIGTQTLDVVDSYRSLLNAKAISAGNNLDLLKQQIKKFKPKLVSVEREEGALNLKNSLGNKTEIVWGEQGNIQTATYSSSSHIIIATPGFAGIRPTIEAIKAKKTIALATKEVLVSAGKVVTDLAQKNNVQILPIDSEHSAIFQCLQGRNINEVERIFLTCSGGPFRGKKNKDLKNVKVDQALNHPTWKMGRKITIDSSTLMNKGFEVIEAHWLFGIPYSKIKVIIHPQSVIHSAVEFKDGSIIAQIGPSDMRLPIQYSLFYPNKAKVNKFKKFHFDDYPNMSFDHPDLKTFKCLELAYSAGREGGTYPAVLNGANDVAVQAFLDGRLSYLGISRLIEKILNKHKKKRGESLDEILEADNWARREANSLL